MKKIDELSIELEVMRRNNEECKRSEENYKMLVNKMNKEKDEQRIKLSSELNQKLTQEKTHQEILLQELKEYKQKLARKEKHSEAQRKEWDRVYGELRRELETLKREIEMLNEENARLKVPHAHSQKETQRMRYELQLLWQVIEDNMKDKQKLMEMRNKIDMELIRAKL